MRQNNSENLLVSTSTIHFPGMMVGVPYLNPLINGREVLLTQKVNTLVRGKDIRLSIVGGAGIGKTAFAAAMARDPRVLKRFRDGILWLNLGNNTEPAVMITKWARLLNIDLVRNATFDNRIRAIQRTICQGEFLIVLDDVSDLESAYRLSCSNSRCAMIVISDNLEVGKSFAGKQHLVKLTGLDAETSLSLVNSDLSNDEPHLEDQLDHLILACEGNPLLMKRAAACLKLNRETRFNSSSLEDDAIPSLFYSYFIEGLENCSDERQKLFYVTESIINALPSRIVTVLYHLGVFSPEPQKFDCEAAMAVSGSNADEIQTLIDLQLISTEGSSFWFTKDIGDYLLSQISTEAIERHRDYYIAKMTGALSNHDDFHSTFSQVKWSSNFSKDDGLIPSLFEIMREDLAENGLWNDYLVMGEKSLLVAKSNSQPDELARLYINLAKVYSILNHKEKSLEYYQNALNYIRPLKNPTEQASILNNIGTIHAHLSQHEKALKYLKEARITIDGLRDPLLEANIYNNLGSIELTLGQIEQASKDISHAVNLIPFLGDDELKNRIYFNFAMVLYSRRKLDESIVQLRHVVGIDSTIADPDSDLDKELLSFLEKELAMPRYMRWMRRFIFSLFR